MFFMLILYLTFHPFIHSDIIHRHLFLPSILNRFDGITTGAQEKTINYICNVLILTTCSSHVCMPYHTRSWLTFTLFEIRCVKSSVSSNKLPLKEITLPLSCLRTPATITIALAFHSTLSLVFLNQRCKWGDNLGIQKSLW